MRMFTKAAAIAATSIIALAPAAMAATYTVAVGGSTASGSAPFTATTGAIEFDTDYAVNMECDSGTATGNILRGTTFTPPTATTVATITDTGWNDCVSPDLFDTELTVDQIGTWNLKATSAPVNGVVSGTITNINAEVRSVEAGVCDFDVSGTVAGSFNSNNQTLTINFAGYPLDISNVSDCFGEVIDGDKAQFGATYTVTTTGGNVTFQ